MYLKWEQSLVAFCSTHTNKAEKCQLVFLALYLKEMPLSDASCVQPNNRLSSKEGPSGHGRYIHTYTHILSNTFTPTSTLTAMFSCLTYVLYGSVLYLLSTVLESWKRLGVVWKVILTFKQILGTRKVVAYCWEPNSMPQLNVDGSLQEQNSHLVRSS